MWSNPGERIDLEKVKPAIEYAIRCGLTRAEICREALISRATLYRKLGRDCHFREWFTCLEQIHAESRAIHRWRSHPFRGRRPPLAYGM